MYPQRIDCLRDAPSFVYSATRNVVVGEACFAHLDGTGVVSLHEPEIALLGGLAHTDDKA